MLSQPLQVRRRTNQDRAEAGRGSRADTETGRGYRADAARSCRADTGGGCRADTGAVAAPTAAAVRAPLPHLRQSPEHPAPISAAPAWRQAASAHVD